MFADVAERGTAEAAAAYVARYAPTSACAHGEDYEEAGPRASASLRYLSAFPQGAHRGEAKDLLVRSLLEGDPARTERGEAVGRILHRARAAGDDTVRVKFEMMPDNGPYASVILGALAAGFGSAGFPMREWTPEAPEPDVIVKIQSSRAGSFLDAPDVFPEKVRISVDAGRFSFDTVFQADMVIEYTGRLDQAKVKEITARHIHLDLVPW